MVTEGIAQYNEEKELFIVGTRGVDKSPFYFCGQGKWLHSPSRRIVVSKKLYETYMDAYTDEMGRLRKKMEFLIDSMKTVQKKIDILQQQHERYKCLGLNE